MGAVITFNDAGTITRGEHKIRGKGIKGFQASYSFKDICGSSQQMNQCIQHTKRYARLFDMGTTTNNCLGDLAGTVFVSKLEDKAVARAKSA